MELQPLNEAEAEQLRGFLERAIHNTQLQLRVQDLDDNGQETYSGHGSADFRLAVISCHSSEQRPVNEDDEDGPWGGYEQEEVHIFIPDETVQYLAGNHPILARMRA